MTGENAGQYLERIGFSGTPARSATETLFRLQRQHLLNVPFENLDIHSGRKIELDIEKLFRKVVVEKRGGFCYELNGLFNELLKSIGYRTRLVSARVADSSGGFGKEFDHMAIIVSADDKEFLVDVGFGAFTLEPLGLKLDVIQNDPEGKFVIQQYDENYLIVRKHISDKLFQDQYIFTFRERNLEDFAGMCEYHQTSPESSFTHRKLCSMPTDYGRKTLTDRHFKIRIGEETSQIEVSDDEEFLKLLREHFNIELDHG